MGEFKIFKLGRQGASLVPICVREEGSSEGGKTMPELVASFKIMHVSSLLRKIAQ